MQAQVQWVLVYFLRYPLRSEYGAAIPHGPYETS